MVDERIRILVLHSKALAQLSEDNLIPYCYLPSFLNKKLSTRRWSSRSSSSTFYIFAIQSIPCSLIKTTGAEEVAVGAKNQFMVLATIVQNADLMKRDGTSTGIINHVRNCRLGCTIPCTQSILSFSLMKRHIILNKKKNTNKRPNANSAMNLADNTLIVVIAATSTFTPHVLPYCPPSNLLNYCVHNTCASLPLRLKVLVHRHPLHLIHSSLEVELHQSDSRFCQLCAQKVNTNFGFYYCSRCDFIAHLDCAADYGNRDNMNLLELKELENEDSELDQSVDSAAYKVKNIKSYKQLAKFFIEPTNLDAGTNLELFGHWLLPDDVTILGLWMVFGGCWVIDYPFLVKMLALTRKVGLSLMQWSEMEYLDGQQKQGIEYIHYCLKQNAVKKQRNLILDLIN
uniref:DC1 domain-containing protein n=1 Tax=Quercus lobata TaxID=97700 RepID=A0A7N2L4N9_QUELO